MSSPTYRISSVADFMSVPVDRIDECLAEFGVWLAIQHIARHAETLGVGPLTALNGDCFEWTDDGKHNATISFQTTEGEPIGSVVFDTKTLETKAVKP